MSFADTGMPNHGVRGLPQTAQVRDLAVRTRDACALWYSGAREAVDDLELLAAGRSCTVDPLPPHRRGHFQHLACRRGGERRGRYAQRPLPGGHQHPDVQNSFVIHAYGEKLAIDGGYYDWYGSPHFKAYSMQTLAHNTLLVDGQGQAVCTEGADGHITAWFDSPGYGYVRGDAADPEIYQRRLTRFDRSILFIKPGFVAVHDVVRPAEPAKLDWLLHAVVPIERGTDGRSFAITCQRAALRGRLFQPEELDMQITTGFPVEPVNRYSTDPVPKENYCPEWRLSASSRASNETEFLAAMQIQRLAEPADPIAEIGSVEAENAWAVVIHGGDSDHLVLFRKPGTTGPMRSGGLVCEGELGAIELDGRGEIKKALAIRATRLQYRERRLWSSDRPDDWAATAPSEACD